MLFLALDSKKKIIFCCNADWLALSCIEVCFFKGKKDRRMGVTKTESYSRRTHRRAGLGTLHVCDLQHKQGLKQKYTQNTK